jgi:hypothetical protein
MNTNAVAVANRSEQVITALSLESVGERAPAVFAPSAHERLSSKYTFIPTARILSGLMHAGFVTVSVQQTRPRRMSALHARHLIRLRRRFETVRLRDGTPELVFLNSHDGSSGYQLRMGIFRFVCANGLIVSRGAFPGVCVSHRGDVLDEVIAGAVRTADEFDRLAAQVECMELRHMHEDEQIAFAEQALALRYPGVADSGMHPSQLLTARRPEDVGDDLWSALNRAQENLLSGGLSRRAASGRLTRTRRISAIREEIRVNSGLWDLAMKVLAA